jgi:hypothetical protein
MSVIRKIKDELGTLIVIKDFDLDKYKSVMNKIYEIWDSDECRLYRENYGKLVLMMPKDYPGVKDDIFYKVYHRAMFSLPTLFEMKADGKMNTQEFKQGLLNALCDFDMLETLEPNIDEAFAGKYKNSRQKPKSS